MRGTDLSTSVKKNNKIEINSDVEYVTALPNPVSSSTKIQFYLKEDSHLNIIIFNVLGQIVEHFSNLDFSKGLHSLSWNPSAIASGTYFVNVITDKNLFSEKILLVH